MSDKPIRVMLVDDEEELVSRLMKRLARRDFSAFGVCCGEDAIEAARDRLFDVAVIDLKMPGMDGIELLRALRKLQPMLQMIMLSGHGSIETAHQSGRLEAFRFLVKPCDFNELVEVIGAASDQKRKDQRDAYQRELETLNAAYNTPHEIMEKTARLREKYEQ